jgi:hypothetical protein
MVVMSFLVDQAGAYWSNGTVEAFLPTFALKITFCAKECELCGNCCLLADS